MLISPRGWAADFEETGGLREEDRLLDLCRLIDFPVINTPARG